MGLYKLIQQRNKKGCQGAMHIIHVMSMSRAACLQEYIKFMCKYIWSCLTQDQCKHLHVCPVYVQNKTLKPAGAIRVAQEVHPDSAFQQETP